MARKKKIDDIKTDTPVPQEELISSYKRKSVEKVEVNLDMEKKEYKEAVPDGMVRCIALGNYMGMADLIFKGEVFDLPERRYKSLAFRGYIERYFGDKKPCGKR